MDLPKISLSIAGPVNSLKDLRNYENQPNGSPPYNQDMEEHMMPEDDIKVLKPMHSLRQRPNQKGKNNDNLKPPISKHGRKIK